MYEFSNYVIFWVMQIEHMQNIIASFCFYVLYSKFKLALELCNTFHNLSTTACKQHYELRL